MDPKEQTADERYNLVGVLYRALHGAENCDAYALDAEAAGRADLYEFFGEARVSQMRLAERAKELLGIGDTAPEAGVVLPGAAPPGTGTPDEDVAPPEEAVPPDIPSPPDKGPPASGPPPP